VYDGTAVQRFSDVYVDVSQPRSTCHPDGLVPSGALRCTLRVHFYSLPMGPKTIPDVGVLQISENLLKYSL